MVKTTIVTKDVPKITLVDVIHPLQNTVSSVLLKRPVKFYGGIPYLFDPKLFPGFIPSIDLVLRHFMLMDSIF
jgi:hypothetical protein